MVDILNDGVSVLADRYDGWILDVWGTIYDGGSVFEGALAVLRNLTHRGLPVAILSNSPRLPSVVGDRLTGLGVSADLYTTIVTSGGEAHRHLRDGIDGFHAGLGARVHTFAPDRFADILPGTRFTLVDRIADADWILNAGTAGDFDAVAVYEDRLVEAAELGLVMICANPDHAVYELGRLKLHAGALAARYEALGGRVHYHGKPHAPVFERVSQVLGISPDRLLMVGDNLATDIAGAAAAGTGSLLLADGIHQDRLMRDGRLDPAALKSVLAGSAVRPDYAATRLTW